MMPLLVSVLPSDLARTRGGGERYAFQLHAALAQRLPGWETLGIVAAGERAEDVVPDGWVAVGGERASTYPAGDALAVGDALRRIPRSADIVVVHQWRTRIAAAMRLRGKRSGTLVGIDHGGGSVAGYRLARLPLPRADVGLHQSEFEATLSPIRARHHAVIRGGTDPARFRTPEREDRTYDVLLVGRFLPHKGQRLLVEALPAGARALLVGPSATEDRPYMDDVLGRAAERGVDVLLDASDDQLVDAYQRARFTIQIPVQTVRTRGATPPELLGLTMLEAMACGSVPIAPATGASAEFVRDRTTGLNYMAESLDDLRRVLADAVSSGERFLELQSGALAEARRWTWSAAAEGTLEAVRRAGRTSV